VAACRRLPRRPVWDALRVSDGSGEVSVRYRRADGVVEDVPLERVVVEDVAAGLPVREFRSYKGRVHYSGWYWAATTGRHVVYESRLELARIMLADHDAGVVGIAAQPFQLRGPDGRRMRRHVPDVLLTHADGTVRVVDVKAPSRLDAPDVIAQFEWTRRVCDRQGWAFEVWSGADAVVLENVRFLAGYRRPAVIASELIEPVLRAAAGQASLAEIELALAEVTGRGQGAAGGGLVRPVVLHLLWTGRLVTDLRVLLSRDTLVRPANLLGAAHPVADLPVLGLPRLSRLGGLSGELRLRAGVGAG